MYFTLLLIILMNILFSFKSMKFDFRWFQLFFFFPLHFHFNRLNIIKMNYLIQHRTMLCQVCQMQVRPDRSQVTEPHSSPAIELENHKRPLQKGLKPCYPLSEITPVSYGSVPQKSQPLHNFLIPVDLEGCLHRSRFRQGNTTSFLRLPAITFFTSTGFHNCCYFSNRIVR